MKIFKNLFTIIIIIILLFSAQFSFCAEKNEKLFASCYALLTSQNFKKAEACFIKIKNTEKGHYPSLFNLSLIYLKEKDVKKALTTLEKAKEYNPYDIRVDRMYSLAYILNNIPEEAKKYLSAILFKKPDDIFSHKNLGLLFLKESNFQAATSEFTMTKNLTPSDITSNMLLSLSFALQKQYKEALEKITLIKDSLKNDLYLAFYAFLLEKNEKKSQAEVVFAKTTIKDKEKIIDLLKASLFDTAMDESLSSLEPIEKYENPRVTKRIIEKIAKESPQTTVIQPAQTQKSDKKWWDLKGEFNQTVEYYDRRPGGSSPINTANTISNLKIEGKTSKGTSFSSQWEWFYNRWDHTDLDYYKVNMTQRDNWEIDIGKFSAKHFPSLVSYPTIIDGIRTWKKFTLPKMESSPIELPEGTDAYVNLGKIYDETQNDHRLFKSTELIAVFGRTLKAIDLNERKEKNEDTYESSGQFEQWSHAYRLLTQLNGFMDIGVSAAYTQDLPYSAETSSSTDPIASSSLGVDGEFNLLDKKLLIDWEVATGNYDEDLIDDITKHKRDRAWIGKITYKPLSTTTVSYEQKFIGKNFKVEGAYQTEDKVTHTMDLSYKPKNPKVWFPQSLSVKFKPEESNVSGGGTTKKRYKTFQSILDFKLPQSNKYSFDYKYYREWDKCACSDYLTLTFKNSIDWEFPDWKTTIKPAYTFERKDDYVANATDEKKSEYVFSIENKSIENLSIKYSFEREVKRYHGFTTKHYYQHIHSIETKYSFIPSRSELTLKASSDFKEPTDTNETDVSVLSCTYNYTTKDRNNKFSFSFERKNNIYKPWSDTSAYRQDYLKFKFTRKF